MTDRKDCKCECHNDGNIRHDKDSICCEKPEYYMASENCKCKTDDWHVGCSIDPHYVLGLARITDTKGHEQMKKLKKYTGGVIFQFDPNTKSLDIYFKRGQYEWNDGAGIQINHLTKSDKEAFQQYMEKGE